jgi:predicted DNA-binding transcriptional regulator YafY
MSEVLRLYKYKELLSSKRPLASEELMAKLEISRATLKRDIAKLRDQLHVPIRYDRELGGYMLDPAAQGSELPGLWFSPQELLSLVAIHQLLVQLEPGLLAGKLVPLQTRLHDLIEKNRLNALVTAHKVRVLHAGKRVMEPTAFERVSRATMEGRRLRMRHLNRQTGVQVQRDVSPQRLVYYRDNWYLDAWCHLREDLRSFSVDAIDEAVVLDAVTVQIEPERLDAMFRSAYGIFSGPTVAWARLLFTPERARWVARELWHPRQETRVRADGSYELSIPYSDDREILGDILRFGPDVQVLAPPALRLKVQQRLLTAVSRYVNETSDGISP